MEIITQNYENILKNLILNNFNDVFKQKTSNNPNNNVFNYIDIMSTLDERICDAALNSLKIIIETIDNGFRNSSERRHKYHIKAKTTRTIMTIFGEITYHKTIYSYKYKKGSYCYIDEYLGFKKYDYFDPYIKSLVIEYASNNPYTKTASIINDIIGNRIKITKPYQYLSKQTVRNIILSSSLSKPEPVELETPSDLYIMADEKFIATQNNNNEDVMVKQIVVFDGRTINKKRITLNNKRIFASFNNSKCLDDSLDYIYYTYNTDLIKNIYVMGDGAKWIKNLTYNFKFNASTNVSFNLDKFHFKQAIHHITQDEDISSILTSYVYGNDKKTFTEICNSLILASPHRKDTITSKMGYILKNWNYINNLKSNHLKCPMESQISHNLADLLSSRPKAYSTKMLSKLLDIRLLFKNHFNLKLLFLNNFNKKEVVTINNQPLNFSIFDKKYNLPSIDNNLIPISNSSFKYDYTYNIKTPNKHYNF